MPISLILADDHPVARRGMQTLLEREPDFSIVGVAAEGVETVRLVQLLKPDVLVLDLMMPRLGGLEALRILGEHPQRTRTVVLSMYSSSAIVAQALQHGAIGYVLKGCTEESLVHAVREAVAGKRFLSPPVTEIAINAYIAQSKASPLDPHEMLTPRQREVLQLAAEGKTSAEIAALLNISQRTVENHRAILMQRLGLRNQTELVRHAIHRGLIPVDE